MAGTDKKQATWGGRFREGPSPLMARFSESVSFDRELARFDIQGSTAHAKMLAHVGLISHEDRDAIVQGLAAVLCDIEAGRFEWKEELEDVHMNIEQALSVKVPAAARLHTARSRNDQVATDMRLYLRDACMQIMAYVEALIAVLVDFADANKDTLVPGYTHLQRAQPVSVAHHFLAYVEMFARDRQRFAQVFEEVNVCPLGSGAIAGSTLPIDREFVARELGFVDAEGKPRFTQNSMDAVADRDGFIDFAHACALCGVHMSRVAEDMILWNSAEFGFILLPDAYTTGSSLMPQKKNPDSMELVRGKSARLQGNLHSLYAMVKGLPLTYNRDLQEDKPPVFDSMRQTAACLQVLAAALKGAKMSPARCASAVADPLLLATDLADYLVKKGVPFRKAHHIVGALVAMAEDMALPLDKLPDAEVLALDPALGSDWREVFDLKRAIAARERPGMPGSAQVAERIKYWRSRAK
ncbi:MAG: argininosuccinate lyase [Opitutales bacterium]|nr:argininosuccinate lyase [Opitutales bacterium]